MDDWVQNLMKSMDWTSTTTKNNGLQVGLDLSSQILRIALFFNKEKGLGGITHGVAIPTGPQPAR